MQLLTVIVPTYNEADNLRMLLPLLQWADEIIVVDSFSTDETIEVAKAHGAKTLLHKYESPAKQKNWAIPQAKHPWVLIFDADERPTVALTKEIQAILQTSFPQEGPVAYWIARQNIFMGKKVRFSGWQNDAVIRLFQRDHCLYQEVEVHEEITTKGPIARLKAPMLHYTYRNMSHFLAKMERYAQMSAKDHFEKTPKVTLYHLRIKPAFRFFKHYVIKQGFRDGQVGFIIAKIMAWGVFMRYIFIREMHNNQDPKT